MRAMHWIFIGLAAAIATQAAAQVTLMHVHGLAYSPDGRRLMIPSHHGLVVYENGKWFKAPGSQHDYMGFSASGKTLYTSGHPAPGRGSSIPSGSCAAATAAKLGKSSVSKAKAIFTFSPRAGARTRYTYGIRRPARA